MVKAMTERERIHELEAENASLRDQLATARLVGRAKCLLVRYRDLTEPEAHHHIEKEAMDRQLTRRAVAEEIVAELGRD